MHEDNNRSNDLFVLASTNEVARAELLDLLEVPVAVLTYAIEHVEYEALIYGRRSPSAVR